MCQASICCYAVQLTGTGGCAGQKWTTRQRLIQEGHRNPVKQLQDGLWQVLENWPAPIMGAAGPRCAMHTLTCSAGQPISCCADRPHSAKGGHRTEGAARQGAPAQLDPCCRLSTAQAVSGYAAIWGQTVTTVTSMMMSCGVAAHGSVPAGACGKHSATQAALLCCSAHIPSATSKLATMTCRKVTSRPVASEPASPVRQQGAH